LRREGKRAEVEREREEGVLDFSRLEECDRKEQREERWRKIRNSRYNKWYKRVKKEGISGS